MSVKPWLRIVAMLMAFALVAAACGGDDEVINAGEEGGESGGGDEGDAMAESDLSGVCPSPLVIQTDWFPEAEHGALYQMIGEGYTVDADNLVTSGPMWGPGGEPTGIDIEVRAGGPAIGFAAPRVQMYTDDSIHLGYTSTDGQATAWADAPLISVIAPLEKNPQMIMWDADVYPDVETLADIGTEGITVNVFGGGAFSEFFVAQGLWQADQVDPSYDGSPARFVAEGNIAQQGFASAEPYNYEFVVEEYAKAPSFQLLHDAGFQVYSQTLGVKPSEMETLRPCLERLVPVIQTAIVEYAEAPERANAVIVDAVAQIDSFWVYGDGIAAFGAETMSELGLHGNGPDGTVGNMEASRIQKIIDDARSAGLDAPDDLTAEDMFTNEFIDDSIGF